MSDISISSDFVFGLIDEIGRHRELREPESQILERIIRRETSRDRLTVKWTNSLDSKLMAASASKGGIKRFSEKHKMGEWAAYTRLHKLRKNMAAKENRSAG